MERMDQSQISDTDMDMSRSLRGNGRASMNDFGKEGALTKMTEKVTSKGPSMTWLWLAGGSMLISAGLAAMKKQKGPANFVGLWVPSLLLIGIYNKLVKLEGSDRFDRGSFH